MSSTDPAVSPHTPWLPQAPCALVQHYLGGHAVAITLHAINLNIALQRGANELERLFQ